MLKDCAHCRFLMISFIGRPGGGRGSGSETVAHSAGLRSYDTQGTGCLIHPFDIIIKVFQVLGIYFIDLNPVGTCVCSLTVVTVSSYLATAICSFLAPSAQIYLLKETGGGQRI